jgi:hypothetical protein
MRRMAAGRKPRKPWPGAIRLLNLQRICSKLLRFAAQILGLCVIRAANQQQTSYVPRGWPAQVAGMALGAARESARDQGQAIDISLF